MRRIGVDESDRIGDAGTHKDGERRVNRPKSCRSVRMVYCNFAKFAIYSQSAGVVIVDSCFLFLLRNRNFRTLQWLRRKPAWVCLRRRHGRKGAEAAVQRAKRSRRTRSSSRGRRWHPTCPCHDRRPRSTRSSRGMAGFLASGTSVSELERLQATR